MVVVNLTSDLSFTEAEFSDSEEVDEFPYKCQQCPEKFRQMCEAQTHFFGAHQNSQEDHLEIKEEVISENRYPENDISENLVSQKNITENYASEDDIFENYVYYMDSCVVINSMKYAIP